MDSMHSRRGFVKGLVATIAATVIGLFTLGRSEPVQAASSRTVLPALTKVPMFRQYQDEPSTNEGKAARRNAYLASVVAAARKVASPSNVYLVKYKEHAFAEEIWVPILIAFSPDGTVHWSDLSRTVGFLWFEQQYPAGRGWQWSRYYEDGNFYPELFE